MPGAVRRVPATLKYQGRLHKPAFFVGASFVALPTPLRGAGRKRGGEAQLHRQARDLVRKVVVDRRDDRLRNLLAPVVGF